MDERLSDSAGLKPPGHRVETTPDACIDYGSGQFIGKPSVDQEVGCLAVSDSRRDGQAVGF